MAETSDMGDTHAVGETVTPKMGVTYAAAETHAVMGDGPLGAYAHVAVPAISTGKNGVVGAGDRCGVCSWLFCRRP
jgi:hypothetical protein